MTQPNLLGLRLMNFFFATGASFGMLSPTGPLESGAEALLATLLSGSRGQGVDPLTASGEPFLNTAGTTGRFGETNKNNIGQFGRACKGYLQKSEAK